jgi:hypothetical protein
MVASARATGTFSLNLMLMNARWFARDRRRYSQMPSPSLVDSREPNGHHFPLFAGMSSTPAVFKYAAGRGGWRDRGSYPLEIIADGW